MKKVFFTLMAAIGICGSSCATKNAECDSSSTNDKSKQVAVSNDKKTMVAYFSATGTTANVAKQIADATGGTLVEIAADPAYTDADLDWRNKESRSSINMASPGKRPPIKKVEADASEYDVVFLGYPIWWDLAPYEIYTYIDSASLDGKRVIPFATSGGSTMSNSAADLKKSYPEINWQEGKLLNRADESEVQTWAVNAIQD